MQSYLGFNRQSWAGVTRGGEGAKRQIDIRAEPTCEIDNAQVPKRESALEKSFNVILGNRTNPRSPRLLREELREYVNAIHATSL